MLCMLAILSRNFPVPVFVCFVSEMIVFVESVVKILKCDLLKPSGFRNATEQVFPLGLFIMLCKVAPIFRVCEILQLRLRVTITKSP